MLTIPDRDEPFPHIDRNTLRRVAPPTPNPLAQAAAEALPPSPAPAPADHSLGIGDLRHDGSTLVARGR